MFVGFAIFCIVTTLGASTLCLPGAPPNLHVLSHLTPLAEENTATHCIYIFGFDNRMRNNQISKAERCTNKISAQKDMTNSKGVYLTGSNKIFQILIKYQ
jgi:hypothetical protein